MNVINTSWLETKSRVSDLLATKTLPQQTDGPTQSWDPVIVLSGNQGIVPTVHGIWNSKKLSLLLFFFFFIYITRTYGVKPEYMLIISVTLTHERCNCGRG